MLILHRKCNDREKLSLKQRRYIEDAATGCTPTIHDQRYICLMKFVLYTPQWEGALQCKIVYKLDPFKVHSLQFYVSFLTRLDSHLLYTEVCPCTWKFLLFLKWIINIKKYILYCTRGGLGSFTMRVPILQLTQIFIIFV